MELGLTKIKEQNIQYRKGVSTPNFSAGLKLKGLKKDSLKLAAAAASAAAITTSVALQDNNKEKVKKDSKLTLNKVLLKNYFRMDMYAKATSIIAFNKTPKENRRAFLTALDMVQKKYKNHEIDIYYRAGTIESVLPSVNDKNLPLFQEIMNSDIEHMKDKKYRRFSERNTVNLLMLSSEENLEKYKIATPLKDEKGEYIYWAYNIDSLFRDKSAKPKYLKEIANSERSKTINPYVISTITQNLNSENESALRTLLNAKTDKGDYRIKDVSSIGFLLEGITKDNIDIVDTLLNVKRNSNTYIFDDYYIRGVLKSTNKDNKECVKSLVSDDKYAWLRDKLFASDYITLISALNSNNSEILPLILDEYKNEGTIIKSKISSCTDVWYILENVSNEDKDLLKSCLNLKDRVSPDEYYFENHNIKPLPDLIKIFKNPDLAPIAKEVLGEKNSSGISRYINLDGIKELCEIKKENDEVKIKNLDYVLGLENLSMPRFTDIKSIVNVTKLLSSEGKRDDILGILAIKDDKGFRFNDFGNSDITDKFTDNLDIRKAEVLSKVKATTYGGYSLDLKDILDIANDYTDLTAEQLPVPDVLPPRTDIYKAINLIYRYQTGHLNLNFSNLKDKIMLDGYLSALEILPETRKKEFLFDVTSLKREIQKSISKTIVPTEVQKEDALNLFRTFFANKVETENLIKNANFSQYGRAGLPLKYSRSDFLKDLKDILASVDDEKTMLKKLQIELTDDKSGYDGIINLIDLNKENENEKKIYDICEKFILKNEINTGDEDFDKVVNSLIKGLPEFINVIGKQTHASHDYSIDIHILETLKNCLNHPEYNELSSLNKTKLKIAVTLHDIAKKEGVVDKNHQNNSALYARNILEKYNLPKSVKDDIFLLVKNHHWLEALNTNAMTKEALSCNFKNNDDLKMSKIFAYSDLKSASKRIFEMFSPVLESKEVKALEDSIKENSKTGNSLFTSRVVYQDRIPQKTFKDNTYKVFDFATYPADKDLSDVGFLQGTKKDDLRFLLHAVSNVENLKTVEALSDVANNSILSESFISLDKSASYYGDGMGVILETDNSNIVNAFYSNQGSGYGKTQDVLVELRTSEWRKMYREYIPSVIQKTLDITEEQYAKLYEIVSQKKFLTQIADTVEFDLDGKIVSGKDVKDAFINAQDTILGSGKSHNEVVVQNSKVVGLAAKESSLENISPEYLDFAQHYNLPVYLLGK